MPPWIHTTWKAESPHSALESSSSLSTPPKPLLQKLPLDIFTRIVDYFDPVHKVDDRKALAVFLRVFKPFSNIIAQRLYSHLDTRWMDTVKSSNPFKVDPDNDPALFLPIAINLMQPPQEIARLQALIAKGNMTPLPRPLDKSIEFCRFLVVTNVDESVLYVICKKVKELDILHIPLATPLIEYHRKAWIDEDPAYHKDQLVSRSLEYSHDLATHTLMVDVNWPSQMATHVKSMLERTSKLYKSMKRLVVRVNSWETVINDYTPCAIPFMKFAPYKDFEQLVILHLPLDPNIRRGTTVFEPNFCPLVTYSPAFFAEYLAQQFHRRSHKRSFRCLIVGLEYGSSTARELGGRYFDPNTSSKVDPLFRQRVLGSIKAKDSVDDVKQRLAGWQLMSLGEFAESLEGSEKHFLKDYVWDILEEGKSKDFQKKQNLPEDTSGPSNASLSDFLTQTQDAYSTAAATTF